MLKLANIRNSFIALPVQTLSQAVLLNYLVKPVHSRAFHWSRVRRHIVVTQQEIEEGDVEIDKLPEAIRGMADPKIIYSSYIIDNCAKIDPSTRHRISERLKIKEQNHRRNMAVPLIIEQNIIRAEERKNVLEQNSIEKNHPSVFFPYSHTEKIDIPDSHTSDSDSDSSDSDMSEPEVTVREEIALRMKAFEEGVLHELDSPKGNIERTGNTNKYDSEHLPDEDNAELHILSQHQGSVDPSCPVSDVPCGGCGAPLHCQQPSLMGFVPKELFAGLNRGELRSLLCQRCYFLREHNTALNVRVSPDTYPKLLEPIREKRALVLVVVDLLDVPCSIWPNIMDIVGTRRPVVIVGNKVDLLPADGKNHLQRVKNSLIAAIENTSLGRTNVQHVALVSAHTGFGIESLITKLQHSWGTKGDMYIIGCTNSGKSTLFNALLGSDLCKTEASTLIRRATVSPWPGTTLNMLKFPILRPSGLMLHLRVKRLKEQQRAESMIEKPKFTRNALVGTLSGHIGRTLEKLKVQETADPFSTNMRNIPVDQKEVIGINPAHEKYALSKWCYDTPGTVQPDQLINLLSHEELMKVLPRKLVHPCSFCLQPGHSLFLAGLARLDLLYSPKSVRFTVFRSKDLPITIVKTVDAAAFYREYLGSSLLGVPGGGEDRLQQWPALRPVDLRTHSLNKLTSCADVVLSSAGWVAVTGFGEHVIELRGWSPGGRGIHLRDPPLLPLAVNLRGARIGKSLAYRPHKIFVPR